MSLERGGKRSATRFSLAQAFTPGSSVSHPFFESPIYGARIAEAEFENLLKEFLGPRRERLG